MEDVTLQFLTYWLSYLPGLYSRYVKRERTINPYALGPWQLTPGAALRNQTGKS